METCLKVRLSLRLMKVNSKSRDRIAIVLLVASFSFLIALLCSSESLFASSIDYINQHASFPSYLRDLFYETKDFFPDFMPHLGAGQNIYNISYYGLYNPYVLMSYAFPFVEMVDYLIVVSVLALITSCILFYVFLRKQKYTPLVAFIVALLFMCAAPLLFHTHRHLMFVNYMPFLIGGLYGVEKYIMHKKYTLLVVCLSMIVYCSFYFAVGSFVALFTYGLYRYCVLQTNQKIIKSIVLFAIKFSIPFLLSVGISSLLWLPTLEVLLSGRMHAESNIVMKDLFIIDNGLINEGTILSAYSMGLPVITFVALLWNVFFQNKIEKIWSLFLLLLSMIPVFSFSLNGFLYLDFKSLIPFIPFVLLASTNFIATLCSLRYIRIGIIICICSSALFNCYYINTLDTYVKKGSYEVNRNVVNAISDYLNTIDPGYYRVNLAFNNHENINVSSGMYRSTLYSSTQNILYRNLYHDVLENDISTRNVFMIPTNHNLISQIYLSEKYIVTQEKLSEFYEYIATVEGYHIYENLYAFPLGYATSNYIHHRDYEQLEKQEKMIYLLGTIISDKQTNVKIKQLNEVDYDFVSSENLTIQKEGGQYQIEAQKNNILQLSVPNKQLYIVAFDLRATNEDLWIDINGVRNKLTDSNWKYYNHNERFTYVVNGSDVLEVTFKEGEYKVNNCFVYEVDNEDLKNDFDSFIVDMDKTKGDYIYGEIEVKSDSIFVLNIPFDSNFKIKVDGKEVDYKLVNESFIGFDIKEGTHNIEVEYFNDLKIIGLRITALFILLTISLCKFQRRYL